MDLQESGRELVCPQGHSFAIEEGVPILTDHPRREAAPGNMEPCRALDSQSFVDPFVNDWIVNSNGNLYRAARGKLRGYPIPPWPLPARQGALVVDIGCGWGRWSVAAGRAGLRPIGVDIHLDAVQAAARVSRQLRVHANFVCAEADNLPLKPACVDAFFSYSVLQHMGRTKVLKLLRESSRVLKNDGVCLVQLPNRYGLLSLLRQAKRGFRDGKPGTFEMRYWSHDEIHTVAAQAFLRLISIRPDGFLSQNPQLCDLDILPPWGRMIVLASYAGRKLAGRFPPLTRLADSLWVEAQAPASSREVP